MTTTENSLTLRAPSSHRSGSTSLLASEGGDEGSDYAMKARRAGEEMPSRVQ